MKTEKPKKRERVTWGDVFPKFRISMLDNGRIKRIRVEGAKKLLLCIETEVKLRLAEEHMCVIGHELSCISYESGAVEISGRVERIFFERRGEGEGGDR